MKRPIALIALAGVATLAFAEPLTKDERESALSELQATRKLFLESVTGLSWNFKPAPEVWSVGEVAEHIAVSEDMIFGMVMENHERAAEPDKKAGVQGKDQIILEKLVDRSTKVQAPEVLRPTHRFASQQTLVDHFKESRDRTIAYVANTQDDLRSHFGDHPLLKTMDGYQWLLLLSAHSHRHTLQIEEVKANPNFPKQ